MKSQINLYQAEFHPKFELYSFHNMLGISVFCLLLCASVYLTLDYYKRGIDKEYELAKQNQSRMENEIAEITQGLATRRGNPALLSKLSSLQEDIAMQRELVAQIRGLSNLKHKSFSSMFDAFSDNHNPNLWLTSFTVAYDDISISGEFSSAKALPNWIASLNKSTFFSGQEFTETSVSRKDDVLTFTLSGQNKADESEVLETSSDSKLPVLAQGEMSRGN